MAGKFDILGPSIISQRPSFSNSCVNETEVGHFGQFQVYMVCHVISSNLSPVFTEIDVNSKIRYDVRGPSLYQQNHHL